MNPAKVQRERIQKFTDLPNIGPAMARDFETLGYTIPADLAGVDPLELYETLCERSGARHDPCVLDTFISVTRFLAGEEPQPWWNYTEERKRLHPDI